MPLSESIARQLPATIWTTDADLRLTFLHSPLLAPTGLSPERLLGHRLSNLVADGRDDHPLVDSHRAALSGRDAPIRLEWGGRTFTGVVGPLRSEAGDIIGCVGVGQAAPITADVDPLSDLGSGAARRLEAECDRLLGDRPDPRALEGVLALLCRELECTFAALWSVLPDGRLVPAARAGDARAEAAVTPFAWLTAAGGPAEWVEDAGAWLMPVPVGGRDRWVLGVVPAFPIEPGAAFKAAAEAAAERLGRALGPRPSARRRRWAGRLLHPALRVRLALSLVPLPFLVWSC